MEKWSIITLLIIVSLAMISANAIESQFTLANRELANQLDVIGSKKSTEASDFTVVSNEFLGSQIGALGSNKSKKGSDFTEISNQYLGDHIGLLGSGQENGATQSPSSSEPITVSEGSVIVYLSGQPVPLKNYQSQFGNYLWIENEMGWSQSASIPQYAMMSLIAYSPIGGQGEIFEIYPSGVTQKSLYNFPLGYARLGFRGDILGKHVLLFIVNNQPSNAIIINVGSGMNPNSPPILGTAPQA
jgi:hypothetical protein